MATPNNLVPRGEIVQGYIASTNSPAPLQLDPNGNLQVALSADSLTISASIGFPTALEVYTSGPQNVSGTVTVTSTGSLLVTGTVGLAGNTANNPLFITGSVGNTNLYQGLPSLNGGVPLNAPSNIEDSIVFTVSLTGSLSASNGQITPLKSDYQGNLASREQFAPLAEDNFNGVYAIAPLPVTASLYAGTASGSLGAWPSVVAKAAPGTLYRVWATNRSTGSIYCQLFNSTTAPAGSAVPLMSFPVQQVTSGSVATNIDFSPFGFAFSVGITVGLSSAPSTYVPVSNPSQGAANFDIQTFLK